MGWGRWTEGGGRGLSRTALDTEAAGWRPSSGLVPSVQWLKSGGWSQEAQKHDAGAQPAGMLQRVWLCPLPPPRGRLVNIRLSEAGIASRPLGLWLAAGARFRSAGDGPRASARGGGGGRPPPAPRSSSCDDFMTLKWPWGPGNRAGIVFAGCKRTCERTASDWTPCCRFWKLLSSLAKTRMPLPCSSKPLQYAESGEVLLSQEPRGGNDQPQTPFRWDFRF